jgi:adenylate kinase
MKKSSHQVEEIKMINAILLGPPGAGKGSVAKLIADDYHLPHISTGDMFREAIAKGTDIGKLAATFINAGKLVPDDVTIALVKERIQAPDCRQGFMFDGFPRTIPQAEALQTLLMSIKRPLNTVMEFDCDRSELIRRITGRRVCKTCGTPYHVDTMKPKVEGICDRDGGPLILRKDDNLEALTVRLKAYEEQTFPLIGFYQAKGLITPFDGAKTTKDLFQDVKKFLDTLA